jgi:hypothetical protein
MHQSQAHVRNGRGGPFWRAYMGVWVVLTGASLAYLAGFASDPKAQSHVVARITSDFDGDSTATAAANRDEAEPEIANREMAATPEPSVKEAELAGKVDALNEELAGLRKKLEETEQRSRTMETAAARESGTEPSAAADAPYGTPAGELYANGNPAPTGSSPLTTASIPTIVNPSSTAEAVSPNDSVPTTNPFATAPVGTNPFDAERPAQNAGVIEDLKPATTATLPPAAAAAPQPEPSPPAETPQRRKGQNLAISPLRAGRTPPLPIRDRDRAATPQPQALYSPAAARGTAPASVINTAASPTAPFNPAGSSASGYASPSAPLASGGSSTPIGFGAATVTPTTTASAPAAALSLSSATSVTALRASWLYLTTRHAAPLTGLAPRYVRDDATGTYRLLAGPIANRAEADRLCNDLIVEGAPCGVTAFSGTPL